MGISCQCVCVIRNTCEICGNQVSKTVQIDPVDYGLLEDCDSYSCIPVCGECLHNLFVVNILG